jgi:hypothetical protein
VITDLVLTGKRDSPTVNEIAWISTKALSLAGRTIETESREVRCSSLEVL